MIIIKEKGICIDYFDYSTLKNKVCWLRKLASIQRIMHVILFAHKNRCTQIIFWNPTDDFIPLLFLHNFDYLGFYDLDINTDAFVISVNLKWGG